MTSRVLLCLVSLLLAAGCAVVDPVDARYDMISRSLTKARNEAIFLNLVRASHDDPLSFVTISNVTPTMTNVSGLGLPSFLLGPTAVFSTTSSAVQSLPSTSPGRDVIFGSSTASNSTSVSSNFNVATQETYAFYQGFLKPIDLTTLNYFIRQGYPHELLFWLFADSFELEKGGRKYGSRYDPPADYGCSKIDPKHPCFDDWIKRAIWAGLTVEEKTQQKPAAAAKPGESSKPTTITFSQFCFSSVLAERHLAAMEEQSMSAADRAALAALKSAALSPKCGSSSWHPEAKAGQPQPDTLPLTVNGSTFRIVPRSAHGVFQFLGGLMKAQRENLKPLSTAYIPPGRKSPGPNDVSNPPALMTMHGDRNLITVVQDKSDSCFVHTWFYDGDYCVPQDATNTKRIFSLLAQLIAIQTAPSDLSITPIVRVIQ